MSTEAVDTAADGETLSQAELDFLSSRGEKGLPEPDSKPEPEKVEAKPDEVKPEPKVEDDPDAEETVEVENKGVKTRVINYGAFHKERSMRKELQDKVAEYQAKLSEREQQFARADERLKLLSEAMTQPAQETVEQPPDPETDIFGYLKWQQQNIDKRLSEIGGKIVKTEEMTQAQRNEAALKNAYVADAQAFSAKTADFGDAYAFLMQGRMAELEASGIDDPAERMKIITDEEKWLVAKAVKEGKSPSERVYNLAKARGYKRAEPKPEPEQHTPLPSGFVDKIDSIAKGAAASKSLSSAGGSPTEVLTAEALANMSEDEFAAWMSKTPKSQQRAILGG